MPKDDPKPGAYQPLVAARFPGSGRPDQAPVWRVLVHRKHLAEWKRIRLVCGEANAQELWEHLSQQPDQKPQLGTVTPMKGRHNGPLADGTSRIFHYEITGGGRLDYRFNARYMTSADADPHKVVQIISIDLGGH